MIRHVSALNALGFSRWYTSVHDFSVPVLRQSVGLAAFERAQRRAPSLSLRNAKRLTCLHFV